MEYLKNDLGRPELERWSEIREAYITRATRLLMRDWQSPAYLSSIENEAGRREGRVIANISDYTRDKHDLAYSYESRFAKEYLPHLGLIKPEVYVTSSGMAALTTIILALHRVLGVDQTVLVGKHSYFQNQEILTRSFARVVTFDENNTREWQKLIEVERPVAIFVDSLCNESELTAPPVVEIGNYVSSVAREPTYLVIDNSLLAIGFPWNKLLKLKRGKLELLGWESLNKYYQFGLDRVTGGVVWGTGRVGRDLFSARMHAGTIMPDFAVAMLPKPSRKMLKLYLQRIESNRRIMQRLLGNISREAITPYEFSGAQVVIEVPGKHRYGYYLALTKKIVKKAKEYGVQLAAGTSFGMPHSRIYITARQTGYARMFLRLSVGSEEMEEIEKIAKVIKQLV